MIVAIIIRNRPRFMSVAPLRLAPLRKSRLPHAAALSLHGHMTHRSTRVGATV